MKDIICCLHHTNLEIDELVLIGSIKTVNVRFVYGGTRQFNTTSSSKRLYSESSLPVKMYLFYQIPQILSSSIGYSLVYHYQNEESTTL